MAGGLKNIFTGYNFNGAKVTGVADAVNPSDVPNYAQVQAFAYGLAWKQSVRAASTANVSLTAPGASLDGVTLAAGDRILLKNQTDASANGIYVWQSATAALTRATDADSTAELLSATVFIREGSVNADRAYTQTVDTITLGTTALTFAQTGGLGLYTGSNGILVSGSTITAVPSTGILVGPAGIAIDPSIVARKFAVTRPGATAITVPHGLATTDVAVSVRDATTNDLVDVDVNVTDANTVTLALVAFPTSLRIVVLG